MITEWECTLNVRGERKVVRVEVDDDALRQAAAEVKAIKGESNWGDGVYCTFSRFVGERP